MAESQTLFRLSQVLPLYIFSIPGPHPGSHIAFPLNGSLVSAGLWQCHHLFLFLMTPKFKVLSSIFSCFTGAVGLGEDHRSEVSLSLHPIGSMVSTRLSGGTLTRGTLPVISWLGVGLSFPHRKVPFSPLCTFFFWSIEGSIIVWIYDMSNMAPSSKPS